MVTEREPEVGDSTDVADLRREIDRLRALVGPSEQRYEELRAELQSAADTVKGAEAAAGVLRGRITELEVDLVRARQDQDQFQRIVTDRLRHVSRLVRRSVRSRLP